MRREQAKSIQSPSQPGGRVSVSCAGLLAVAGLAQGQVIAPQQNVQIQIQPGNQLANQNLGPPLRKVFTDEAVGARESLVRVEELAGTGNLVLTAMDRTTPEMRLQGLQTDVVALYERLRSAAEEAKRVRGVRVLDNELQSAR